LKNRIGEAKITQFEQLFMKRKFPYLYISFILSIVVLVTLSFLFYKRLNSHINYTSRIDDSYSIVISLRGLEENMAELESSCRGFLLIGDSLFIPVFNASRDNAFMYLDSLKMQIEDNSDQMRRFLLMRSTVMHLVNIYGRSMQVDTADNDIRNMLILRSNNLRKDFREESLQIEKAELSQRTDLLRTKEFYEEFYPNYFNSISIWAGIITLVSFYFINREVRMRTRYQYELEKRLNELNRLNSELSQFTFIASHDLQEPLRKIRTFSDKLVYKYQGGVDDEVKHVIGRIEASAKRMQELLQDMLNFTNLINKTDEMSLVDLNLVIPKVLEDFAQDSRERHAIITWDKLPEIHGNRSQLRLLFRSLIDNAFKFAKQGEPPQIKISYRLVDGNNEEDKLLKGKTYHKIILEDKGIGFNNEFAEKIFMIFQRLHTQHSGYRGKGIGLAIAQRIMINHNGIIQARGMVDDGATFVMYFPA
jgi:signal transduction histidine kinase